MMTPPPFYQLMLITRLDGLLTPFSDYLNFIQNCVVSGVTSVQLRAKNLNYDQLYDTGQRLLEVLVPYDVRLIVNDHLELALSLNADGVHLGQTDDDPQRARQELGPNKIIGLSINHKSQLHNSQQTCVDYLGAGPVFTTRSKTDSQAILGLRALQQITSLAKHPVIAVGGINTVNANLIMQTGVNGIACIEAIHDPPQPEPTVVNLVQIINLGGKNNTN